MNDALAAWQPSRQQRAFRGLMNAFAYPGRIQTLAEREGEAVRLVLATLVDAGVSLADPGQLLDPLDLLRLGCEPRGAEAADFILAEGLCPPAFEPRLGSLENPDQSATLIIQVARLGEGVPLALSGPGVPGTEILHVSGLAPEWLSRRAEWVAGFPMGVDVVLVDGLRAAALPRTVRIVSEGVG